ncbi:hypothetical protein OSG_eHP14_00250 [environmental Halophage eHP-14]|nr:hypothetical protein OSG_eHP14_00250 [environmental Halophage eHP-14]
MPIRPSALVNARTVDWQTVSSSNVHSALYNEGDEDFYVRFLRSGPDDIYIYPNRTPSEWEDFRTATSKGSWIWDNPIDQNWSYELLTTRDFSHVERDEVVTGVRKFLF